MTSLINEERRVISLNITFSFIGLTSLLCVPFNSVSGIPQHVYYDYRCLLYPDRGYLMIKYWYLRKEEKGEL